MSNLDDRGQALLELTLGAALLALTLTGAAWVLRIEWRRTQCAHVVFEATRAAVRGQSVRAPTGMRLEIRASEDSVTGEGRCGDARETVSLRRLEHAPL